MLRGIYSVAGAMEMASRNQEIVAENLTNAATPGYRRQGLLFEVPANAMPSSSGDRGARTPAGNLPGAANPVGYTHYDPGPLEQTHNPLDIALTGNGFFVVDGPNGPLYTRNG